MENSTSTKGDKPRQSTRRVLNIRGVVEPKELAGGRILYQVTVTNPEHQQEDVDVSPDIYKWVVATKPMYRVNSDWMLTRDEESGLVVYVTERDRNPAKNTFQEAAETAVKHLTIIKYPDGEFQVAGTIPAHVREDTVQDVIQSLVKHGDSPKLRGGMLVGRYLVLERREPIGHDEFLVDPMARQV